MKSGAGNLLPKQEIDDNSTNYQSNWGEASLEAGSTIEVCAGGPAKKTADGPGEKKRAARGKKKAEPAAGVADPEAEAKMKKVGETKQQAKEEKKEKNKEEEKKRAAGMKRGQERYDANAAAIAKLAEGRQRGKDKKMHELESKTRPLAAEATGLSLDVCDAFETHFLSPLSNLRRTDEESFSTIIRFADEIDERIREGLHLYVKVALSLLKATPMLTSKLEDLLFIFNLSNSLSWLEDFVERAAALEQPIIFVSSLFCFRVLCAL